MNEARAKAVREAEAAYQKSNITDNQLDTLLSFYRDSLAMVRTHPELFGSALEESLTLNLLRIEDMAYRRNNPQRGLPAQSDPV